MRAALVEALKSRNHPLFLVGTGVSIAATGGIDAAPLASWTGLLRHGLRRAHQLRHKPDRWLNAYLDLVDAAATPLDLIRCAAPVEDSLERDNGEWAIWLKETAGSLTIADPEIPRLLVRLGRGRLATTNYDDILTEASEGFLKPVPWTDGRAVAAILRGEAAGVVHLHGHWATPESVVLGYRSYEDVVRDKHTQAFQRAVAALHSLVFVGYGAGLEDPNFGPLLRYLETFSGDEHRHFRLCLKSEIPRLESVHPPNQRVLLVPYGDRHDDLAPFLRDLCSEAIADESTAGAASDPVSTPHPSRYLQNSGRGNQLPCKFFVDPNYRRDSRWKNLSDVLVELVEPEGFPAGEDWTRKPFLIPSASVPPALRNPKVLRQSSENMATKRRATELFVQEHAHSRLAGTWFKMRVGGYKINGKDYEHGVGVHCPEYDAFLSRFLVDECK